MIRRLLRLFGVKGLPAQVWAPLNDVGPEGIRSYSFASYEEKALVLILVNEEDYILSQTWFYYKADLDQEGLRLVAVLFSNVCDLIVNGMTSNQVLGDETVAKIVDALIMFMDRYPGGAVLGPPPTDLLGSRYWKATDQGPAWHD